MHSSFFLIAKNASLLMEPEWVTDYFKEETMEAIIILVCAYLIVKFAIRIERRLDGRDDYRRDRIWDRDDRDRY